MKIREFGKQEDGTWVIRSFRYDELLATVAKLNRKAVKLGGGLSIEKLASGEFTRKRGPYGLGVDEVFPWLQFRIAGTVPVVEGYRIAARIEHHDVGNIVCNVPGGEPVSEAYRTAKRACVHCSLDRRRKDTYIVRGPEGEKQVGSGCLEDFLRSTDAASALKVAKLLVEFELSLGGDEWCGGGWRDPLHGIGAYLAHVVAAIRVNGWMSRGMARDREGAQATCDVARFSISPPPPFPEMLDAWKELQPIEADHVEAAAVVAWGKALADREGTATDYLHNLTIAFQLEGVEDRNMGLVASAVMARRREQEKAAEQAKREAERAARKLKGGGSHVGKVGERMALDLTVMRVRYSDGQWGSTTIVTLEDADLNEFTWFATGSRQYEGGQRVRGKGTVKKHDYYEGRCQTVLSRCSFEVVEVEESAAA